MDKRCSDRADAESERGDRDKPPRAKVLAGGCRRDFEDDVADVEDCEDDVVVISFEAKVLLQAREFGIACTSTRQLYWATLRNKLTDIGPIDEAEQVEQSYGWNDIEIDFVA